MKILIFSLLSIIAAVAFIIRDFPGWIAIYRIFRPHLVSPERVQVRIFVRIGLWLIVLVDLFASLAAAASIGLLGTVLFWAFILR